MKMPDARPESGARQQRRSNQEQTWRAHFSQYLDFFTPMATKSDPAEFLATEFPQTNCTVEAVGSNTATVRREIGANKVRPGSTVSGPVLMTMANVALGVAILGEIGIVPVGVTTSLGVDYMRTPEPDRAIASVRKLMKLGKSLAVGQVSLYFEGLEESVAHAVGTYSIPM